MARPYTKNEVQVAVENSRCYSDVFRQLGIKINGGSYVWIKRLVAKFEINISHFLSASEIANEKSCKNKIERDYLTDDISKDYRVQSGRLYNFMTSHGVEYQCSKCNLTEWLGIPLRLDVDHIDGNSLNNNINNLQFLCPNCHRQKTIKYVPQQSRQPKKQSEFKSTCREIISPYINCPDCGVQISRYSTKCRSCVKKGNFKIEWPSDEELKRLLWTIPTSKLAKVLGVSDVAITKRCKNNNIEKPPVGYWAKNKVREEGFEPSKAFHSHAGLSTTLSNFKKESEC